MSALTALRSAGTKIVFDSGDIELLMQHHERWCITDATPSASLLLAAASEQSPHHRRLASNAVRSEPPGRRASSQSLVVAEPDGDCERAPLRGLMSRAADSYAVGLGADLLSVIPGRVSTEVDSRFAYNTFAIVEQARGARRAAEKAGPPAAPGGLT